MICIKYLRYLILHKWYVAQECWRRNLWFRAIVHDWSKFLPSEFIPYARYFYGKWPVAMEFHGDARNHILNGIYQEQVNRDFDVAWLKHQHRQPHHWQHWVLREDSGALKVLEMPYACCMEMVSDWIGAGRAINPHTPDPNDPFRETRKWYLANKDKMQLHPTTRKMVEIELCMYKEASES